MDSYENNEVSGYMELSNILFIFLSNTLLNKDDFSNVLSEFQNIRRTETFKYSSTRLFEAEALSSRCKLSLSFQKNNKEFFMSFWCMTSERSLLHRAWPSLLTVCIKLENKPCNVFPSSYRTKT